jgi:hypothetical protein
MPDQIYVPHKVDTSQPCLDDLQSFWQASLATRTRRFEFLPTK